MHTPDLKHFRLLPLAPGFGHLLFDTPGQKVNLLSASALKDLERIADWLPQSGLRGVVLSSAKAPGFCAGADLTEVAPLFDQMAERPDRRRAAVLQAQFPTFTRTFRRLETAGVPIAAAIRGATLGGALELALACHGRILTDQPETILALPEVRLGMFPAGGGSQRLPRLVAPEIALPILLDQSHLTAAEAVTLGLAERVVPEGQEVAAALAWLQGGPDPRQPWDRPGYKPPDMAAVRRLTAPLRSGRAALSPCVGATLDAVDQGLGLEMSAANAVEVAGLFQLMQRPEPHAMLATGFHGRSAWLKAKRSGPLPVWVAEMIRDTTGALRAEIGLVGQDIADMAMELSGFTKLHKAAEPTRDPTSCQSAGPPLPPGRIPAGPGILGDPEPGWQAVAVRLLAVMARAAWAQASELTAQDRRLADYCLQRELGLPVWSGGPLWLAENMGEIWARRMAPGPTLI